MNESHGPHVRVGGRVSSLGLLGELHVNLITNKSFTQNSWVGKMKVIFDILDRKFTSSK
jgi:hypothetical protein